MAHFPRRFVIALAAAASLALAGCAGSADPQQTSTPTPTEVLDVGIAQIVDHPSLNNLRDGFKQGMAEGGFVEGQTVTYEARSAAGDQSTLASIAASFGDKDLIVAIATPTAQAMAQAQPDKPIFFAGVTDPVGADLVVRLDAPGGNLTGTSDFPPVADQLAVLKEIVPEARTIGLLYSSAETNSHIHADLVAEAAPSVGLEVRTATVTNSSEVAQAAESLKGVDAFFIGTDNTVVGAIESVVAVAEVEKIPLIVSDPDSVERGALAAFAVDYLAQGVLTGQMAAGMLNAGKTPADVPVQVADHLMELSVNPAAAERMGVRLPDTIVTRADRTVG